MSLKEVTGGLDSRSSPGNLFFLSLHQLLAMFFPCVCILSFDLCHSMVYSSWFRRLITITGLFSPQRFHKTWCTVNGCNEWSMKLIEVDSMRNRLFKNGSYIKMNWRIRHMIQMKLIVSATLHKKDFESCSKINIFFKQTDFHAQMRSDLICEQKLVAISGANFTNEKLQFPVVQNQIFHMILQFYFRKVLKHDYFPLRHSYLKGFQYSRKKFKLVSNARFCLHCTLYRPTRHRSPILLGHYKH